MNINEMRTLLGLSQKKFGIKYDIPLRTIQDWEYGRRTPPNYVLKLLERAVKEDYIKLSNSEKTIV